MRQEVLEWMRVKKIREYRDVSISLSSITGSYKNHGNSASWTCMNSFERIAFRRLGKYAGKKRTSMQNSGTRLLTAQNEKCRSRCTLSTAIPRLSNHVSVSAIPHGAFTWAFISRIDYLPGSCPRLMLTLSQYSLIIGDYPRLYNIVRRDSRIHICGVSAHTLDLLQGIGNGISRHTLP